MRLFSRGGRLLAVTSLLASLMFGVAATPAAALETADTTVFINEIHYDNTGGDTGEFVEIYASTDVTGWSVIFYNGSTGASYATATLTGGPGFLTVSPSSIQNGSPDGIALADGSDRVIQFLSYEGSFAATNGPASGLTSTDIGVSEPSDSPIGSSLQLTGTGTEYGDFTWAAPSPETPGTANTGQTIGDAPPPPPPPAELNLIHEIQGSGASVAISGDVRVQGIVTALFEDDDAVEGFHMQEEDTDADADPATSEAIFVFCDSGCPVDLAVGDLVTVAGSAGEFSDTSQIFAPGGVTIDATGQPLPTATSLALPAPAGTDQELTFEAIESMIVSIDSTLTVSEYFELARFGNVVLYEGGRPQQFTDENTPSVSGYEAHLADLATRRIILDDNNNDQNEATSGPLDNEPYPYPTSSFPDGGLSTTNFFRGGETITGLTGVIDYDFGEWRVRPIDGVAYEFTESTRPASPDDVGGSLTVATMNVLNYFTTIDTTSSNSSGPCGPSGTADCRGADSEAELDAQRAKIVAALIEMDAAIVGLVEIENDGDDAAVADLVAALNAAGGAYDYIPTGFVGGDAIKVALIYQPAEVFPVGGFEVFDSSDDPAFNDDRNRAVLIQSFEENATGERFTVAVNHLKSKGSNCEDLGDPDAGDGQGNCNLTRTAAAAALADFLATDPTGIGDPDTIILGDLNSYAMEDPITALKAAGYTDLLDAFQGSSVYTYLFDGQTGYLDYVMSNATLTPQVTGATAWNINADEIPLFDYNDAIRDAAEESFRRESSALPLFSPDPYRSSDHDPVLIGLQLVSDPLAPAACTPGYWTNHLDAWGDLGGLPAPYNDTDALLDMLNAKGKGSEALRHTAAALLNRLSGDYPYSFPEILGGVSIDELVNANESLGCGIESTNTTGNGNGNGKNK